MSTFKVGTWREVFLKLPGDINEELGVGGLPEVHTQGQCRAGVKAEAH